MKKIIYILFIIINITTIISLYRLICNFIINEYQITITSANRQEISDLINNYYNDLKDITRIRYKPELGDGEIKLYNKINLVDTIIVDDEDDICYYIKNNGFPLFKLYLLKILLGIFLNIFFYLNILKKLN